MSTKLLLLLLLSAGTMLLGCSMKQASQEPNQTAVKLKTTRLHMYGFKKTKSGAV